MRNLLVTVVDDDESVRESLPDLLRELGFTARTFASAEQFLASGALAETTACLIADVAMPGLSGPQLHRELLDRGVQVPVIFITARADPNLRTALIAQGAVECLFKPFTEHDLRAALAAAFMKEKSMGEDPIRAALDRHWAASDADDFQTEHSIYLEDAVLQYPQSGELIRGRSNIQLTRSRQPSKKRFKIRRIMGSGALWITEYILTYDGKPSYTVSIMEFSGDRVARETQYFADPFEASAWRAQWVERMPD